MANNWTREELIIAFNLYCKIPFSKSVKTNPDVIKVAKLIGRTPSSVAFKLGNFGSFDPELKKRGIAGLKNAGKLDKVIWDEFNKDWEKLAYESEILINQRIIKNIDQDILFEIQEPMYGSERESLNKTRINQNFFRASILSLYNQKCCITGINIPDLLIASHIIPWSKDEKNRLNPQNGLCLNALHDRAFDKGYITITPNYTVKISNYFEGFSDNQTIMETFYKHNKQKILLPDKFLPSVEFLYFHNERIFRK